MRRINEYRKAAGQLSYPRLDHPLELRYALDHDVEVGHGMQLLNHVRRDMAAVVSELRAYVEPDVSDELLALAEAVCDREPTSDDLDRVIDGIQLRGLLELDRKQRLDQPDRKHLKFATQGWEFSPAQRAAISAHWSAELSRKVNAAEERERNQVRVDLEDEDEWDGDE